LVLGHQRLTPAVLAELLDQAALLSFLQDAQRLHREIDAAGHYLGERVIVERVSTREARERAP
jgi:hypothetical protein